MLDRVGSDDLTMYVPHESTESNHSVWRRYDDDDSPHPYLVSAVHGVANALHHGDMYYTSARRRAYYRFLDALDAGNSLIRGALRFGAGVGGRMASASFQSQFVNPLRHTYVDPIVNRAYQTFASPLLDGAVNYWNAHYGSSPIYYSPDGHIIHGHS